MVGGLTINKSGGARQKATLFGIVLALALIGLAAVAANSHADRQAREAGILRVALQPNQTKTKLPSIQPLVRDADPDETASSAPIPEAAAPLDVVLPPPAKEPESLDHGGEVLKLSYRLEPAFDGGPDGVEVRKRLVRDGAGETSLPIFLMGGTRIEVERDTLASALAELKLDRQAADLPDKKRLTLENVRSSGVDLTYDAIRDRLVLKAAPDPARP